MKTAKIRMKQWIHWIELNPIAGIIQWNVASIQGLHFFFGLHKTMNMNAYFAPVLFHPSIVILMNLILSYFN